MSKNKQPGWPYLLVAAGYRVHIVSCRAGWRVSVLQGPTVVEAESENIEGAAREVALLVLPQIASETPYDLAEAWMAIQPSKKW